MFTYLADKELYVFQALQALIRSTPESSWLSMSSQARPVYPSAVNQTTAEELESYGAADFTLVVAPGFTCILR